MGHDRNRHASYSQKAVPRQKRTIQLYGEDDYRERFYRCWNCGFINDRNRAMVADTFQGGDGSMVEEYGTAPSPYGMGAVAATLTIDTLPSMTLMAVDANGNIVGLDTPRYVNITGGCAFCGCMNYR
jgi:hypothetical protein